jgi:hypothetical protein
MLNSVRALKNITKILNGGTVPYFKQESVLMESRMSHVAGITAAHFYAAFFANTFILFKTVVGF